jgi:outer membrane receptor protein involved in Fe transport
VRTSMKLSLVALTLTTGMLACAEAPAAESRNADLQRDIELASATTMNLAAPRVDSALLNAMETQPQGTPEVAKTVRRGAGSRAVRSETPTVRATPVVEVAELEESEEVQTESIAPALEESSEPVAVAPRPAPAVIPTGGEGGGDYGTSGTGGGIFGGGAGSGGVVIRGGGVDGDNCELHRRPRSRGGFGGPIMMPNPNVPRTGMPVYDSGRGVRQRVNETRRTATSNSPRPTSISSMAGGLRGRRR